MDAAALMGKNPEYVVPIFKSDMVADDSGFPFDDDISETGSDPFGRAGLRSHLDSLAARHPEFAQHLGVGTRGAGTRPANNVWGSPRKRRGSGSLGEDDARSQVSGSSGEEPPRPPPVRGFPFDDFPSDFRQHMPEDFVDFPAYTTIPRKTRQVPQQYQQQSQEPQVPPQQAPPKKDFSTQTDDFLQQPSEQQESPLKQYGLRNTVDLGQKTQPALEEEAARGQRSMSAPPEDNRNQRAYQPQSQGPQPYKPGPGPQHYQPFKSQNQGTADNNMGQYISGGQKNPNATEQQNHQKSGSPRPQSGQPQVRHIPIFVEGRDEPVVNKDLDQQNLGQTKNQTQQPAQESPKPKAAAAAGVHHGPIFKAAQNFTAAPKQATPPRQTTPPPPPVNNDPISKIQNIQKDVLELMSQVEVFRGTRQEKQYVYLDEMLTRNLLKLDDVDTEGKENIRQARKEAIKCIQKCIAVLEAKADSYAAETQQQEMGIDKNDKSSGEPSANAEQTQENKQKVLEENSQNDITSNGDTSKAVVADTPSNENKQETASSESQPATEQQAMEVELSTTPKVEAKPSQ